MHLTPLDLYILLHIKRAKVEYAKMIMKMTELKLEKIQNSIEKLVNAGLLERDSGSAIKRTRARFKRASEVHKHHTYYHLSKEGTLFVREIDKDYLKNFFNSLIGDYGFEFIIALKNSRNFKDACKKSNNDCKTLHQKLMDFNFITEKGNKTRFFNRFVDFAEI